MRAYGERRYWELPITFKAVDHRFKPASVVRKMERVWIGLPEYTVMTQSNVIGDVSGSGNVVYAENKYRVVEARSSARAKAHPVVHPAPATKATTDGSGRL